MNEFYEGIIAGIAMLGGLCAFNYWVFNLLEKSLEIKIDAKFVTIEGKIDHLEQKIDSIAQRLDEAVIEQTNQRQRSDQLYQILINLIADQKMPRTSP